MWFWMSGADAVQAAHAMGKVDLPVAPHCPLHPGAYFQDDWCNDCALEIEWAKNRPHLQLVTDPANGQT